MTHVLVRMPTNALDILSMMKQDPWTLKLLPIIKNWKNNINIIFRYSNFYSNVPILVPSHTQTLLSLPQVARNEPDCDHATDFTSFSCPSKTLLHWKSRERERNGILEICNETVSPLSPYLASCPILISYHQNLQLPACYHMVTNRLSKSPIIICYFNNNINITWSYGFVMSISQYRLAYPRLSLFTPYSNVLHC